MPQDCHNFGPPLLSRRDMLRRAGMGFGLLALADLLCQESRATEPRGDDAPLLRSNGPAKSVIFLFIGGGPSQVDTFDPKPLLNRLSGGDVPESIARDIPRIARSPLTNLFASPYRFRKHGQS